MTQRKVDLRRSVGWALVVMGLIAALAGFAHGDPLGLASRSLRGEHSDIIIKLISVLPGMLVSAVGLFVVR